MSKRKLFMKRNIDAVARSNSNASGEEADLQSTDKDEEIPTKTLKVHEKENEAKMLNEPGENDAKLDSSIKMPAKKRHESFEEEEKSSKEEEEKSSKEEDKKSSKDEDTSFKVDEQNTDQDENLMCTGTDTIEEAEKKKPNELKADKKLAKPKQAPKGEGVSTSEQVVPNVDDLPAIKRIAQDKTTDETDIKIIKELVQHDLKCSATSVTRYGGYKQNTVVSNPKRAAAANRKKAAAADPKEAAAADPKEAAAADPKEAAAADPKEAAAADHEEGAAADREEAAAADPEEAAAGNPKESVAAKGRGASSDGEMIQQQTKKSSRRVKITPKRNPRIAARNARIKSIAELDAVKKPDIEGIKADLQQIREGRLYDEDANL